MKKAAIVLLLLGAGLLLLVAVSKMPRMGDSGSPDKTYMVDRYVARGAVEAGDYNVPNDVLLNYRAFDSMGCAVVLFTAFCAVLAILGRAKRGRSHAAIDVSPVSSGMIPMTVVQLLVPVTILFAAYVLFAGHDSFGYSLQAGLLISGTIILITLVFSLLESTKRLRTGVITFLESLSVLAFLVVGLLGIFLQGRFLSFSFPGLHGDAMQAVRLIMMVVIGLGIGIATAVIFTSTLLSLMREEGHELERDIA